MSRAPHRMSPSSVNPPVGAPPRLRSLDAYRGLVMLAMCSGGFGFATVAKAFPGHGFADKLWQTLGYEFSHVPWTGCSFWDLIQPSFMFIVGAAMPFSYAARRARGSSYPSIFWHSLWRCLILIALAVFLSSNGRGRTEFVFTNVLAQIGLGYMFVFVLLRVGFVVQLIAALAILGGYWYAFYDYAPPDPSSLEIPVEEPNFTKGLAQHWDKHTNYAAAVDRDLLNKFPRDKQKPFLSNPGGYQTLNFVPSIVTMLFGVMAGYLLLSNRSGWRKVRLLLLASGICFVAAMSIDHTIWPSEVWKWVPRMGNGTATLCPIVKRIWTPSWTIFSGGWTFLLLAVTYGLVDVVGLRRLAFPFAVVGMNSITIYCMYQLMKRWTWQSLGTHLGWVMELAGNKYGPQLARVEKSLGVDIFNETYMPIVQATSVIAVLWLICLWMYRRKIFVRI